jgi:hypothetical protein
LDDVIEWKKKKRKSEFDQSEKELKIRAALYEAENIDVQKKLKAGHGPTKFLEDEEIVAKRYAKRDDFKAAEDKVQFDRDVDCILRGTSTTMTLQIRVLPLHLFSITYCL